jgi:AraC family transcriptional regulator
MSIPEPRIEIFKGKKLLGKRMIMSFANNSTLALWQQFMPLRKQIPGRVDKTLYSVEDYPADFFNEFDPNSAFEKWAAVEVNDALRVPEGLELLLIPGGLYAVFLHRGPASEGPKTYEHIFRTWLPNSKYTIDQRPHFAVMGDKYKQDDPTSEEEIWIPVRILV